MARLTLVCAAALLFVSSATLEASDWARFRGPNGSGVSPDAAPPVEWSDEKNLAWRVELPGPGHSCPIVVGDRVFVTCWTGYGLDKENPGDQANLKRMIACYDRNTGEQLWSDEVDAKLPEDEYGNNMFGQHGYATHTPVCDGERVFVYFGMCGALAYDMQGERLWQTDCGDGRGIRDWGSSSSPLLAGDLMICAATAESNALIALNKTTGEEVWRHTEEGWNGVWGSPILAEAPAGGANAGRSELVFSVPFKLIALDPATGEVLWHCRGLDSDTVSSSAIAHDGVVYVVGNGGAIAVRAGGSGEVDDTQVVWRGQVQGGIPTPVYHDGKLYSISRGGVACADAATGERVFQGRFENPGGGGEGGGGGGRGGFMSQAYSSPVAAGDFLYHFGRGGETHVVRLGAEFEQVARNTLADGGDFSATPALSDGELFVRSTKYLYCIKNLDASVAAATPPAPRLTR